MMDGNLKLTVYSIAIVSPDLKNILCFLDETIPDYKQQIAKYKMKGFGVVHLNGDTVIKNKNISLNEADVRDKLGPFFEDQAIDVIVRKLGF